MTETLEIGRIATQLTALLVSEKDPIASAQLHRSFRELFGGDVPYLKLGFATLDDLLQSIPDRIICIDIGGRKLYKAQASGKLEHIRNLVEKQKRKKPTRGRGRGRPYSSRGGVSRNVGGYGSYRQGQEQFTSSSNAWRQTTARDPTTRSNIAGSLSARRPDNVTVTLPGVNPFHRSSDARQPASSVGVNEQASSGDGKSKFFPRRNVVHISDRLPISTLVEMEMPTLTGLRDQLVRLLDAHRDGIQMRQLSQKYRIFYGRTLDPLHVYGCTWEELLRQGRVSDARISFDVETGVLRARDEEMDKETVVASMEKDMHEVYSRLLAHVDGRVPVTTIAAFLQLNVRDSVRRLLAFPALFDIEYRQGQVWVVAKHANGDGNEKSAEAIRALADESSSDWDESDSMLDRFLDRDPLPMQDMAIDFATSVPDARYVEIEVYEIRSVGQFYAMMKTMVTRVNNLQEAMQAFYTRVAEERAVVRPEDASVGMYCVAPWQADHDYYRARIVQLDSENGTVEIEQIDFGTLLLVPLWRVKYLDRRFADMPRQAIAMQLTGFAETSNHIGQTALDSANRVFADFVASPNLLAFVASFDDSTERYNVELCIEEEREDGTKEFHFCTQALEAAISDESMSNATSRETDGDGDRQRRYSSSLLDDASSEDEDPIAHYRSNMELDPPGYAPLVRSIISNNDLLRQQILQSIANLSSDQLQTAIEEIQQIQIVNESLCDLLHHYGFQL